MMFLNKILFLLFLPMSMLAQDKLFIDVVPEHENPLEWEQSLNFKLFIKDQDGINRKANIIIDDKISDLVIEEYTIQSGYHEYTATVPFGKDNGIYKIEFTAERENFESDKTVLDIIVDHYYVHLFADVRPAAKFILDWGESIDYEIDVVDEFDNSIENADIWIMNELDGSVTELKSNLNGFAEFSVDVPHNIPDSTYYLYFLISKYGFSSTDTLIRRIQVRHINNVFEGTDRKFKVYPQPAAELLIIESNENQIFDLHLYDIYGKSIPINNLNCEIYSNSYKLKVNDFTSGVYFLQVDIGSDRFVKKIIISE